MSKSSLPILKRVENRYTMFPINHPNLWKYYKNHVSTFWTLEECRLSDDLVDWNKKLNDNERYFIKNILAFFAASDGVVNENLVANFYSEIHLTEARAFFTMQMLIETIHSEVYSALIDTYVSDTKEKNALFNAVETNPAVMKKANWAIKWIEEGSTVVETLPTHVKEAIKYAEKNSDLPKEHLEALNWLTRDRPSIAQRLAAFICVEGLFFSGSFCAIFWLKNRGLLPGLCSTNEFISRDENLHVEFGIELYNMLDTKDRLSKNVLFDLIKDAVEIEKEFILESLPVSLIGMNSKLMSEYIEYVADRISVQMNYPKIFNTLNPFSFMELISMERKNNFFENNTTEYSRSGIGTTEQERSFSLDEEF